MLHVLLFPLRKIPIMQSVLAIPGSCPKTSLLLKISQCTADPGTASLSLRWSQSCNSSKPDWPRNSVWILGTVPRRDPPVTNMEPETVGKSHISSSARFRGADPNERIRAPAFAHAYCLRPSDSFQSRTLYSHVDV